MARSGYFSGGDSPAAKPIPPLRERILPSLKRLAEIDALQQELDRAYTVPDKRTGKTMDPDEYFHLMHVLEKKRDRIDRAETRAYGKVYTPPSDVPSEPTSSHWPRLSLPQVDLTTFQKKLLVIGAIVVFLFIRHQFFA